MRHALLAGVLLLLIAASDRYWAARAAVPVTRPDPAVTTSPTTRPATQPAISETAQLLLDQMRDAYAALKSLELAGSVTIDFDAAERQDARSMRFTSSFQAPLKFHHEMSDDVIVSSSGERVIGFVIDRNQFTTLTPPKQRGGRWPREVLSVLSAQNPSLLFAFAADAGKELTTGAERVHRLDDVQIDGVSYPAIQLVQEDSDVRALIDPTSHLLKQLQLDLRKTLQRQDVPAVKKALITIDYTRAVADAPIDAARFAWAPPTGATEVKSAPLRAGAAEPSLEPQEQPAYKLIGKPAPTFTLSDLDGTPVSLESLKGQVVVLDFWASWCAPCREGLNGLEKTYKSLQNRGLKVFAINQGEEKLLAESFLADQGLNLPVLLDTDRAVGDLYLVQFLPQTVVVDKDGVVHKVYIGVRPDTAERLAEAIEEALKAK